MHEHTAVCKNVLSDNCMQSSQNTYLARSVATFLPIINVSGKKFKLAGGNGASYGPNFGPLYAEAVAAIENDSEKEIIVLKTESPIIFGEDEIEYVLISPRYGGESVIDMKGSECIVNVSLVLSEELADLKNGISDVKCRYWSIGRCWSITA